MKKYTFTNSFTFEGAFWRIFGWGFLVVITGGLAFPFFMYYFVREMIQRTEVHENE